MESGSVTLPPELASVDRAPGPGRGEAFPRFDIELGHPESGRPTWLAQVRHYSIFPGSRTWIGRVAPDSLDELVLTVTDDAVSGLLTLGLQSWELTGSLNALVVQPVDHTIDEGDDEVTDDAPEPGEGHDLGDFGAMSLVSTGPYGVAGQPVVDLLVVYSDAAIGAWGGSEAALRTKLINNVGLLANALSASQVDGQVRLVGLEKIDWTPSQVHPKSTENKLDAAATLAELRNLDGKGDEALELRESLGADVVVGVVPKLHKATGLAWTQAHPGPSVAWTAFVLRSTDAADKTLGHEVAHAAGLRHWRDEHVDTDVPEDGIKETPKCQLDNQEITDNPRSRYGYIWPAKADADNGDIGSTDPICADKGIRTMMAGVPHEDQTVNEKTILADDYVVIERFANPNLTATWTCPDDGLQYTTPTGSTYMNGDVGGCTAEAAWRLNETWPAVAEYRPMKPGVDGADMISPAPGSNTSSTTTFSWTGGVSPLQTYWLEVYTPSTGAVWYDNIVISSSSTVSKQVTGLPTSTVLAARLWTYMGPSQWTFKDYRYRSANQLVSCSAEDPNIPPDANYASASCNNTCTWSSSLGRVSCNLYVSSPVIEGIATIVSDFQPGDSYDLAMWGRKSNGVSFCCLMHDPNDAVDEVRLYGSTLSDTLSFRYPEAGYELRPYGSQFLSTYIYGSSGDDVIHGSNTSSSSYSERLSGQAGADVLYGHGGDDDLYGGSGDDELHGGNGNDFLSTEGGADLVYGGAGNDTLVAMGSSRATLYGQAGSDVLCANHLGVRMFGSTSGTGGWNIMYWSSTAGGTLSDKLWGVWESRGNGAFEWCGHANHGGWQTWCDSATLSTAPVDCASAGLPQ